MTETALDKIKLSLETYVNNAIENTKQIFSVETGKAKWDINDKYYSVISNRWSPNAFSLQEFTLTAQEYINRTDNLVGFDNMFKTKEEATEVLEKIVKLVKGRE